MNVVLKMRLFELGMKQRELAPKVGISQAALSQIVQGKVRPSLDVALAIAKEVGMTVEQLWGDETQKSPHPEG